MVMGKEINMVQTFTQFLESIFGQYSPILTYDSTTGDLIDSSINFGYIASVVIFGITLGYLLKTIGGVIYEWLRR